MPNCSECGKPVRSAIVTCEACRSERAQNAPLTLEELRGMARNGGYAWCADTDGTHPGLLCYVECVLDDGKEAHIWLLDNERNARQYSVRYMLECGAKFYRRKPDIFKATYEPVE